LAKRLSEALNEHGISSYLEKHLELDVLKGFAERLGLAAKGTKAAVILEIVEAVEAEGVRLYFESFPEDVLRDAAFDMKLTKDPAATHSRPVLVDAIIENKEIAVKDKKKKEKIKVSKTKPSLTKGVNYQDIFQHYNLDELVEWAKKNGIKVSGTKKELILRIIAWLEGDKENTLAGTKKTPKRKKRSGSVKKAGKKSTSDSEKKEVKPKAAPKKETEAEGDDEEIDLDKLESYSVAKLKKYCEDEGIKVTGTTKKSFVDAISAYNEDAEEEEN